MSHCLFNYYVEYITQNARLVEEQARIKIAGINNLRYADDTTLMAECEEELKNILMRVKEESEKASLKLNIQKLSIWHLVPLFHGKHEGKKNVMAKKEGKVEAATDFIFLGLNGW